MFRFRCFYFSRFVLFLKLAKGLLFERVNNLELNRTELLLLLLLLLFLPQVIAQCCVLVYCLLDCSLSNWPFLYYIKFTGTVQSAYLGKWPFQKRNSHDYSIIYFIFRCDFYNLSFVCFLLLLVLVYFPLFLCCLCNCPCGSCAST